MINVMLVDDEPLVRITMKSVIPWDKYGFRVAGEAENGKQCIDMLEIMQIDLIITDIKMPVIDGLTLISVVKETCPDIFIIVLSAYEEFNLVKKALVGGAEDYILKSEINQESTIKALECIKEKFISSNAEQQKNLVAQKDLNENIEVLRQSFLKKLLSGTVGADEGYIEDKLKKYGVNLCGQKLVLMVLVINKDNLHERLVENIIKNFVDELYKQQEDYYCLISDKMEISILQSYHAIKSENKIFQAVNENVNKTINSINKFLDMDITVGVSKIFNGFASMDMMYRKTKELLSYSFPLGKGNIFFEQDFEDKNYSIDYNYLNKLSNVFRNSINKLDFFGAKNPLNSITLEFTKNYSNENYQTLKFYCKLMTAIVDKSIELRLYNRLFKGDVNPYEYILSSNTIFNVEDYLLQLLDQLEEGSGIELQAQYGETIGKVISYVLQNYNEDINLNKVAQSLSFNASYLSSKFKAVTKKSFNEFLNTTRINNAKKLMAERKYKINRIATMVGYHDQRYFCKIFKKYIGATPQEYIKSL